MSLRIRCQDCGRFVEVGDVAALMRQVERAAELHSAVRFVCGAECTGSRTMSTNRGDEQSPMWHTRAQCMYCQREWWATFKPNQGPPVACPTCAMDRWGTLDESQHIGHRTRRPVK